MTRLLTTAQVATALGVTPSRVSQLVKAGQLAEAAKANGLRGPRFFHPDELARVLALRAEARPVQDDEAA